MAHSDIEDLHKTQQITNVSSSEEPEGKGETSTKASRDLVDFISSVSGDDHLVIEENLGDGFVRLRTAEAERRQAKHDIRSVEDVVIEMLRNARDAHASHIFVAVVREANTRTFTFLDDGDGVPEHMRKLIFEPRVTSKLETMVVDHWGVHGRGMALYSIKSNAESACIVSSGKGMGSSFQIVIDLSVIDEKSDQSTFPKLERKENGELTVGTGPHNVIRTTVEFALECRDKVTVYLGTPTDIAAELFTCGRKYLSDEQLLFCDNLEELPVCLRPSAASDAAELMDICASLGIAISERTAHRIMAGQIKPAIPPLSKLTHEHAQSLDKPVDIYKDRRSLKISKEDIALFSRSLETSFETLCEKYYLQMTGKPKVRVGKDSITVKFLIEKDL